MDLLVGEVWLERPRVLGGLHVCVASGFRRIHGAETEGGGEKELLAKAQGTRRLFE